MTLTNGQLVTWANRGNRTVAELEAAVNHYGIAANATVPELRTALIDHLHGLPAATFNGPADYQPPVPVAPAPPVPPDPAAVAIHKAAIQADRLEQWGKFKNAGIKTCNYISMIALLIMWVFGGPVLGTFIVVGRIFVTIVEVIDGYIDVTYINEVRATTAPPLKVLASALSVLLNVFVAITVWVMPATLLVVPLAAKVIDTMVEWYISKH